eukprot:scaffold174628_cov16-Tisochrysis_lutea.AAC.1
MRYGAVATVLGAKAQMMKANVRVPAKQKLGVASVATLTACVATRQSQMVTVVHLACHGEVLAAASSWEHAKNGLCLHPIRT